MLECIEIIKYEISVWVVIYINSTTYTQKRSLDLLQVEM